MRKFDFEHQALQANLSPAERQRFDRLVAELKALFGGREYEEILKKEDAELLKKISLMLERIISLVTKKESVESLRPTAEQLQTLMTDLKLTPASLIAEEAWTAYGGQLTGPVKLFDDKTYPVVDGKIFSTVGDRKIIDVKFVRRNNDGWYGVFCFEGAGMQDFLVVNGEVRSKIAGRDYVYVDSIDINNGIFSGAVCFESQKMSKPTFLPVIDDFVVMEIDGAEIVDCRDFSVKNGQLNCRVRIIDTRSGDDCWCPVVGSKLIREWEFFDGIGRVMESTRYVIVNCAFVIKRHGRLSGLFNNIGERDGLLVIDDKVIEEIDGESLYRAGENVTFHNGRVSGVFSFPNLGGELPVVDGKIIREIDGLKIKHCHAFQRNGDTFDGSVSTAGEGVSLPVIAGKLITEIEGRQILFTDEFHNIAGTLNGRFQIEGSGPINMVHVVLGKIMK